MSYQYRCLDMINEPHAGPLSGVERNMAFNSVSGVEGDLTPSGHRLTASTQANH